MRYSRIAWVGLGLMAALVAAGFAAAQDVPNPEAEMAGEMEAWAEAAVPGEHHEELARLVGDWTAKTTFWMQPGAEPMKSEGTAHNEMILGGRFLLSKYDGQFMGQPFQGLAIDGFDNITHEHIGMWMDSFGTMMLRFTGECARGGKVRKMEANYVDPMGNKQRMKGVTTIVSANEHRYEGWQPGPDGEMFKSMEVVYSRK